MIGQSDDLATLKTLTSTLNDSVNGYREAAKDVHSNEFREMFTQFADDRSRCSADLQAEVRRLGGEPDNDGSTLGGLHQTWLDLKAAVTGRDDKAILNEVERGEDYLKEKFETALNGDHLTGESRTAVERAYQSVRAGHDRMSALKHGLEA
ncbi:PA2169 family four-helix-bundle protein [Sphingomonas sp. HDW15A]|uniref:ferritin-like domain-containing protein n=1 Tax=Sphingomonas sp. HDW15A TaxID=2714942 RepID=UPI001407D1CA|nr:PA2169 family four-helix-bundle protein [Sphingomonas sp. HDW15A]QIK96383.1 PA2169 family four-helix-bundle protein [Sphingomonas sp. HDW15A]